MRSSSKRLSNQPVREGIGPGSSLTPTGDCSEWRRLSLSFTESFSSAKQSLMPAAASLSSSSANASVAMIGHLSSARRQFQIDASKGVARSHADALYYRHGVDHGEVQRPHAVGR